MICSCSDGHVFYCDAPPQAGVMASFRAREDGQIMGLEILSIALGRFFCARCSATVCACVCVPGISSFADLIRGRNVVIWSDNTGAEAVTKRGTAKTFDHCCLAHALWKRFAELQLGVWVERVPTEVNIADDPSRYVAFHAQIAASVCLVCLCKGGLSFAGGHARVQAHGSEIGSGVL